MTASSSHENTSEESNKPAEEAPASQHPKLNQLDTVKLQARALISMACNESVTPEQFEDWAGFL